MISLSSLAENLSVPIKRAAEGKLVSSRGSFLIAKIPDLAIGDTCYVSRRDGSELMTQAVGFQGDLSFLAPFDRLEGISPNAKVRTSFSAPAIKVSENLIAKVIDPLGNILSGSVLSQATSQTLCTRTMPLQAKPPCAINRLKIDRQIETGISSIDLFLPIGYGQRAGLFAGPGAGKSTLLGMICRNACVDLVVIALIGERSREVSQFLTDCLGPEGLKRSILVVSTSDESSLRGFLAAQSATAIAEYFRDQGKNVLLLLDSLSRAARAVRDVSLAAGELPIRQGFTPSVYAELPKLPERAGNSDKGSITAIYTILTQNDESNDALGEETKSILDGHIVLSQDIANQGIRPAIDILLSVSRLTEKLLNPEEKSITDQIRKVIYRLRNDKDVLLMGGQPDAELTAALKIEQDLINLLSQNPQNKVNHSQAFNKLKTILDKYKKLIAIG